MGQENSWNIATGLAQKTEKPAGASEAETIAKQHNTPSPTAFSSPSYDSDVEDADPSTDLVWQTSLYGVDDDAELLAQYLVTDVTEGIDAASSWISSSTVAEESAGSPRVVDQASVGTHYDSQSENVLYPWDNVNGGLNFEDDSEVAMHPGYIDPELSKSGDE
jgi:hypothetical protein